MTIREAAERLRNDNYGDYKTTTIANFSRERMNDCCELADAYITADDCLAADVLAMCKQRDWSLHWTARGAYLHLESSELIEAIRGKHGDPKSEAADVLIVLMSITENAGIVWGDVLSAAKETVAKLRTKPRYAGEEFTQVSPAPPEEA